MWTSYRNLEDATITFSAVTSVPSGGLTPGMNLGDGMFFAKRDDAAALVAVSPRDRRAYLFGWSGATKMRQYVTCAVVHAAIRHVCSQNIPADILEVTFRVVMDTYVPSSNWKELEAFAHEVSSKHLARLEETGYSHAYAQVCGLVGEAFEAAKHFCKAADFYTSKSSVLRDMGAPCSVYSQFLDYAGVAYRRAMNLNLAENSYAMAFAAYKPHGEDLWGKFNQILTLYSMWTMHISTGDAEGDWELLHLSFVIAGLLELVDQCHRAKKPDGAPYFHWCYSKCVHETFRDVPSAHAALRRIAQDTRDSKSMREAILMYYLRESFPSSTPESNDVCLASHLAKEDCILDQLPIEPYKLLFFYDGACAKELKKSGQKSAQEAVIDSSKGSRMALFQTCANPRCESVRSNFAQGLLKCSGCRKVYYCSPECQKRDWKRHKSQCKGGSARPIESASSSQHAATTQ